MSDEKNKYTKSKLSKDGTLRVINFVQDIALGRKDVVVFYLDSDGVIRELGTRKKIEVTTRKNGR